MSITDETPFSEETPLPDGGEPTSEHIDLLDNVLKDTSTPAHTRRSLLKYAATGTAVAAAAGMMDPVSSAFARGHRHPNAPAKIGTIAVTAEAFAVTYLTKLLKSPPSDIPKDVAQIVAYADQEEFDHYHYLRHEGFKPLTTKFYLPNALFGPTTKGVAAVIELAETLFINAYLIGITSFARRGKGGLARLAGEIAGVESEHRALARFAQGKIANDRGFEQYKYRRIDQIVAELEKAGVGFGKPTAKGGPAYRFPGNPRRVTQARPTGNRPR